MKALIIVDVQVDFLPEGALAVPTGDTIIPAINALQKDYDLVVATQDWHPADHGSFASQHPGAQVYDQVEWHGLAQTLWPDHCVQGTAGAELAGALEKYTIEAIFRKGTERDIDSYSGFFVAAETFSISRLQAKMNLHQQVNDVQLAEFKRVLNALREKTPIQHIVGHAPFYGFVFEVNEHTLIPRPETEELVHLIIQQEKSRKQMQVLDIGTGSGCIAISLAKKLSNAEVEALDISSEALVVARRNAAKLNATVRFIHDDMLKWRNWEGERKTYDVIVSNPPYITPTEKLEMSNQVLDHEPHSALFVEETDPLIFYREIAAFAARCLTADGALYFEINQYLAAETKAIVEAQGFSQVAILEDINGAKRMLYCRR